MNNQANRTVATSARTRRTVLRRPMLAVPVLIAVLAGSAVGVNATDDTDPDDTELDGLVTEEVEPGVERIISDGAGHDLDERHPTYRYDMDDVAVTPDGAVLALVQTTTRPTAMSTLGVWAKVCLCSSGHSGSLGCPSCPTFTASLCRKRRALACTASTLPRE